MLILWQTYEETVKEEEEVRKSSTKKRSMHVEATIRIGKKGVTEAQIKEISKQLDARKKVKVKILKTALVEATINEIAQKVAS